MMLSRAGDHLQPRVEIVRLQFQRLAEIFHVFLFGGCLLREIQIIIGCFGCMILLRGTLLIILREEPLRQRIRIVLALDLVCVRIHEMLQSFQNLFCFSAHFMMPPVPDLWMAFQAHAMELC